MIPVLVLAFYLLPMDVRYLAAAFVFSIASLTDWLDGHLARSMEQTTPFGAFLDPVADKLLVAVALILLVEVHARAARYPSLGYRRQRNRRLSAPRVDEPIQRSGRREGFDDCESKNRIPNDCHHRVAIAAAVAG